MPQSHGGRESDGFPGNPANDVAENERLALEDEDMSLPWLESDDDEFDDTGGGSTRLAGFVLGSLVVLGLIVGGIWWVTNRGSQAGLVADGSVIKAPAQPYKEAPEDPGGKTFAGTGDTSFAVSAGQTRPARLGLEGNGEVGSATGKEIAAAPAVTASPAVAAPAPEMPAPKGVGVQVGAYYTPAAAEAGWTTLTQRYEALSGFQHRVVEGKADIGTVYRLQAVTADAAAAQALCSRLKASGLPCQVKN